MNTESSKAQLKFNPKIHSVGSYRLCRKPAEGEIIQVETLGKLEIALYQGKYGNPEWRILEPENPVPVDRIEITRAEGPIKLCGKTQIIRRENKKGTGQPGSIFEKDWSCSAFICANSEFMMWGMTAPKNGGYDKCDFEIFWTDGSHYAGRFDLQHGGTDAGETFSDSFRSRIFHYSGLVMTPHHFKRKNAIEEYSDVEARELYHSSLERIGFMDEARNMLATLEI